MTPTEKIDAALDSVLVVMALKLDDYKRYPVTLGRMRAAMRKIMTDSYIEMAESYTDDLNATQDAMKGK